MKKQFILLTAFVMLAGSFANAQTDSGAVSTKAPKSIWSQESSSKGVRVGILKPYLDGELKASGNGESVSRKEKVSQDVLGFSLGYANLPVQQVGWTANLGYLSNIKSARGQSDSWNMMRVDGNMAYAFNEMVNVKGGLNLSKMVSGPLNDKFSPSIGYQAGAGVQFTPNLGLDLNYVSMNQTASVYGASVEFKFTGFELALHGTF